MDRRNTDMKNKIKKIITSWNDSHVYLPVQQAQQLYPVLYGQMKQNKTLRLQKSQKQKMQLWKKKLLIRQMIKQKTQI